MVIQLHKQNIYRVEDQTMMYIFLGTVELFYYNFYYLSLFLNYKKLIVV